MYLHMVNYKEALSLTGYVKEVKSMNGRIGQQLGNYRLIRRLGSGGFAEVYLGEHVYLKTQTAIKVLPMQLTSDEIENFSNEARTIANLKHPHIISVLDFGIQESTSTPFLVMDYAPNGTLRQRYTKGTKLSPTRLLPYIKQVAEALQYAHDNNIIHRDVKPENILLAQNNIVLLSDFGLAIVVQSTQHQQSQQNMGAGTIAYTAPEQSKGKPCVASDQYSLGAIVYEMLCGVRPFDGTPMEIMVQHALSSPPPMHEHVPSILAAVEFVVQKALAKDPKQRFATIHEFALALEEACQRENSENRTLQLVSAGHAAIPLAAATSLVEREHTPPMVATPPQDSSVIWNVPYRRNPFFTGRENILASLHEKLHAGKAMSQIQAISGLGGSGKTQIAVEYAYRHHSDYSVILWLRGDRRDILREDRTTIASHLSFKGKSDDFIGAVRSWLKTNTNWLLILDNVENLTLLRTFIPSNVRGHVLLTTRTQATGTIAQRIDLGKMARDEAKLFLLRRIKKLFQDASLADASHSDMEEANEIAELLGDLPLALDQAGAYIEETGCSLKDYLSLCNTRRAKLLAMRGGIAFWHHYKPGQYAVIEPLIEKELAYAEQAFGSDNQHVATIRLKLAELYYKQGKYSQAEQLFLQSLSIKEQHVGLLHACVACNFNGLGLVCLALGKYSLAQSYFLHALMVWERLPEPRHPFMGRTLNALARLSIVLGKYTQAEVYLQRERMLLEQTLQPLHPAIINSLNEWAVLCMAQGRYDQVEILLDQAQTILTKTVRLKHPIAGRVLHTLAQFYTIRGKYVQAEQILQEVLGIREQALGFEHLEVAAIVNTLADVYVAQSQRSLAEALYKQALEVREKLLGPEHPDVAQTLNGLAGLYFTRTEYQRAEQYYKQALAIREKALGSEHPDVAQTLNDLARLYSNRRRYDAAEPLFRRALAIREKTLGSEHIEVGATKKSFSLVLWAIGKRVEATACIKHVKQIQAKYAYVDILSDI